MEPVRSPRLLVGVIIIVVFFIGIRIAKAASSGECSFINPCPPWEACNVHNDPPECVKMNDCRKEALVIVAPLSRISPLNTAAGTGSIPDHTGLGCDPGEVCCGGGPENCVCPSPRVRDKKGHCRDCDCPWNERCTTPHGDCVCDEHQVRDHQSGSCVDCDPDLSCPNCGIGRTCHVNQGGNTSSCECLPGSVEQDGECVWCHGCPKDCEPDHVCITPGFAEPYCGCPPGTDEIDGKCIPCPRCPDCTDGKVCVVQGSKVHCECPSGTVPQGHGCLAMPHPVFHKRGGQRYGKDNKYYDRYGSGHYGRGYYGSGRYDTGHYGSGSGHYGSYPNYNHGSGPLEEAYYGSGHFEGLSHGKGHYRGPPYGNGHHGHRYRGGPHGKGRA